MRRLSLWIRAHPMFGDSVLAALLLFSDVVLFRDKSVNSPNALTIGLAIGVLLAAPLAVRRRFPLTSAYVVLFGGYLQLFVMMYSARAVDTSVSASVIRPADFGLGIALYTLVAYAKKRQALLYALWCAIGTVAWTATIGVKYDKEVAVVLGIMAAVTFALFWVAGQYFGARQAYNVEVERRLNLLETERDQEARIAVAAERARIARELHDVVAHAVSVMVVHSDGAAFAIHDKPELAESAVQIISDTGRSALVELRRLLGVLRGTETEAAERAPQPDAGGLSSLADKVGLPVRLELAGDVDGLPAGIGLNLYRIIQEALTNTLKHGGDGASAVVAVRREEECVTVHVDDNGRGGVPSEGNGLIGMRERAAMHGGTIQAGPGPKGGWRVSAVLPLQSN